MKPLYRELVLTINAQKTCIKKGNNEWVEKHQDTIDKLMNSAPSGSGIDCGTTLEFEQCTDNKLVFSFSYHHMDQNGMYCGWSENILTVTPSLLFEIDLDFEIDLSGADVESLIGYDEFAENEENEEIEVTEEEIEWVKDRLTDYLYDVYQYWLTSEAESFLP